MNEPRWNRSPAVILTALQLEYAAVRDRLAGPAEHRSAGGTRFEVCPLEDGSGEVALAAIGQGNHGAAVIAAHAIHEFSPSVVLFAGIAGALKPSLPLGAVVFATHVYAYHGAAARTGGMKSRPRVWETDHAVVQAARAVDRRRPAVHFGPVASGEVLHDAPDSVTLRWVREHFDDALAIEMEASGVAAAGHLSGAPVGVVRAISDRADGTKSGTDGQNWQQRAAGNAAAFAVALAADLFAHREEADGRPAPATGVQTYGGNHGAVAGVINGGVHNTRLSGGPIREERSWW